MIEKNWKDRKVPGYAVFRWFSSVLRRVAPCKSLLQSFEFVCQLKTKSSLFGNVFTPLRNNFRWLKSLPGPWARFYSVLRRVAPLKSLLQLFSFLCQVKTKPSLFGNVFTILRNNFRWFKASRGMRLAIFRRFPSSMLRVAPLKSLL